MKNLYLEWMNIKTDQYQSILFVSLYKVKVESISRFVYRKFISYIIFRDRLLDIKSFKINFSCSIATELVKVEAK